MSKLFFLFVTIILSLGGYTPEIGAKHWYVFWDLGGVLIKPSKLKMACREIGVWPFIQTSICDIASGYWPQNIKKSVFEIMYQQGEQDGEYILRDTSGAPLPLVMVEWLTGARSSEQILTKIAKQILQLDQYGHFKHKLHKVACQKVVHAIFDPGALSRCATVIDQGVDIVRACALYDTCTLCIASNWDPASFQCLYGTTKGQKLFKYFDKKNMFISGFVGIAKPQPAFWHYIFSTLNIMAQDCVFIDDQQENIEAADELGMCTYQFDGDYKKLQVFLADLLR